MNSRFIKFTDVSEQCASDGYVGTFNCPYSEIWITHLNTTVTVALDSDPIVSQPAAAFTTDFHFTNGIIPSRKLGGENGTVVKEEPRQVIETVGGRIFLRTEEVCWYIDSNFCSGFHDWKRSWGSPSAAYAVGVTIVFFLWAIVLIAVYCSTFVMSRRAGLKYRMKLSDDEQSATPTPMIERICLVITTEFTVIFMALRFLLLIVPWPFFTAMFSTCWSCYDFEAAVAHEVGHLLGLGHPDLAPFETLSRYEPWGANVYHTGLAAGVALDNSSCLLPWAGVTAGVPSGVDLDPVTKIRPSIMHALTRHNPRSCLMDDDLEALNVLYPDCAGAPLQPLCNKAPLNTGWLRMLLYIVVPMMICLLVSSIIKYMAARRLRTGTCGIEGGGPADGFLDVQKVPVDPSRTAGELGTHTRVRQSLT